MLLLLDILDEWSAKAGPRHDFLCRNLDGSPSPTASAVKSHPSMWLLHHLSSHVVANARLVALHSLAIRLVPIPFVDVQLASHVRRERSRSKRNETKEDVAMRVVR